MLCATRGRPLPNWIERSVRESRTNFTSYHQVACSGAGSIPLFENRKGDRRMRFIGTIGWSRFRELHSCCFVRKARSKQPNVCRDLAEKIYFSSDHKSTVRNCYDEQPRPVKEFNIRRRWVRWQTLLTFRANGRWTRAVEAPGVVFPVRPGGFLVDMKEYFPSTAGVRTMRNLYDEQPRPVKEFNIRKRWVRWQTLLTFRANVRRTRAVEAPGVVSRPDPGVFSVDM